MKKLGPQFHSAIKKAKELGKDLESQLEEQLDIVRSYTSGQVDTLNETIEAKLEEIDNLDKVITEKEQRIEFELQQKVAANEAEFIRDNASKHGLAVLTFPDHSSLVEASMRTQKDIDSAVEAAEEKQQTAFTLEANKVTIELATLKSELAQKEREIQFLAEQLERKDKEAREMRELAKDISANGAKAAEVNVNK